MRMYPFVWVWRLLLNVGLDRSRPENATRAYTINTTFPNRVLDDEKQTIDTQRALNLKKLELKTACAQLHTWAELFVITLEERTSNVRFLFEVYLLIGHSSSRGCETRHILGG